MNLFDSSDALTMYLRAMTFPNCCLDDSVAVKIWDVSTGECVATLQGHSDDVNSVSFDPSGDRLASGSWNNSVKTWII
eukprot:COSAG02_NODE_19_length_53976_cov_37.338512_36_plen_78_part_00